MKIVGYLVCFVAAIFIVLMAIGAMGRKNAPAPDPQEVIAVAAADRLKAMTRDPSSLTIEDFIVTETSVCVTYRARNGFGGMSREHIAFNRSDLQRGNWNSLCAGKSGRNLTRFVQVNSSS